MDSRVGILNRNGGYVYYCFIGGTYVENHTLDGIEARLKQADGKASCRSPRNAPNTRMIYEYIVRVTLVHPYCDDEGTEVQVFARSSQEAIRHARHQMCNYYDRHDGPKTYRARRLERAA